jgi:ariadne-1
MSLKQTSTPSLSSPSENSDNDSQLSLEEEENDQDFNQDDDIMSETSSSFSPILPAQQTRKPFQIEFTVWSTQDLIQTQQMLQSQISSLLSCSHSTAATLLRYFKWNKEKLLETFLENPQGVSQAAGVLVNEQDKPLLIKVKGFVCDICCNDDPELLTYALACQHRFCQNCYTEYIERKITQEGESRNIQCPSNCSFIVDESTVALLVQSRVLEKYYFLFIFY